RTRLEQVPDVEAALVVSPATEEVEEAAEVGHGRLARGLLPSEDPAEQVADLPTRRGPAAEEAAEQVAETATALARPGAGLLREAARQPRHDQRGEEGEELGEDARVALAGGSEALFHHGTVVTEDVAEDLLAVARVDEGQRVGLLEETRVVVVEGGGAEGLRLAGLQLQVEAGEQCGEGASAASMAVSGSVPSRAASSSAGRRLRISSIIELTGVSSCGSASDPTRARPLRAAPGRHGSGI